MGVNAVLLSLPYPAGSTVAYTTHRYDAVGNALRHWAKTKGWKLKPIDLPFPLQDSMEIASRVLDAIDDSVDLTGFGSHQFLGNSHSLSSRASSHKSFVKMKKISILVDAAHSPAHVDIGFKKHRLLDWQPKWCCSPKGAALLYVHPKHQKHIMLLLFHTATGRVFGRI